MKLRVISTGSVANCYGLYDGDEVLLLDAGVPIKRVIKALGGTKDIAGCLITHEHGDHSRGAAELVGRGVPTYASAGTKEALQIPQIKAVEALKVLRIGRFEVMPFYTQHDAIEPFGFLIHNVPTGERLVYATDTYYLQYTFPSLNYWLIECNYCEEIASAAYESGKIDKALFDRLKKSHLSLRRLKELLSVNDLSKTRKIVLLHLSDGRSDEARMIQEIHEQTGIETVAADCGMDIDLSKQPF